MTVTGRGALMFTLRFDMRANAIPYVVEAPARLLSSLDLPTTLPRHAFD